MEEFYMIKIWQVIALKENQNLTVNEQQNKIIEILSTMKKDVETSTKRRFKKEVVNSVNQALNEL